MRCVGHQLGAVIFEFIAPGLQFEVAFDEQSLPPGSVLRARVES
ncbi:hypothetical protein ACWERY_05640 [Streptomyces sp. NPDC004082]